MTRTVIDSNIPENLGPLVMLRTIYSSRELIVRLFLRDFVSRYKQSYIGWAWTIINPLIGMATFYALGLSGALRIGSSQQPYIIYGFVGLILWQLFSGTLMQATDSLLSASSFITKINFPREVLVISSVGQPSVEFLIKTTLLLILHLLTNFPVHPAELALPIIAIPVVFWALGIGFVSSVFGAAIRDTRELLNIILGFALFTMPVMYSVYPESLNFKINSYNPIFVLIYSIRDLVLGNDLIMPYRFLTFLMLGPVVFFFGWFVFRRAQSKITELL